MAAQGAFGTDFYYRSIRRPKHRAYYCSGRPVIKIGPKGALGSLEIRPIHSAPSLGQSIGMNVCISVGIDNNFILLQQFESRLRTKLSTKQPSTLELTVTVLLL